MGEQAVSATVKLSRDPHIPTKLAAAQATGSLLRAELDGHLPDACAMEALVPVLVALLGRDQNSEVQRQGLQVRCLLLFGLCQAHNFASYHKNEMHHAGCIAMAVETLSSSLQCVGSSNTMLALFADYTSSSIRIPARAGTDNTVSQVIRRVCVSKSAALEPHWPALLPSLCSLAQDTAGPTKLATDRTLARMLMLDDSTDKAQSFLSSGQAGSLVKSYLSDAKLRALSKIPMDSDDMA